VQELFVVPAERHVERLAREGRRGETRSALRTRLVTAFLPDVAFTDARTSRLALAMALADDDGPAAAGQLDLFGAANTDAVPLGAHGADALIDAVRVRGGASWARLIAALDDAITALRARGATLDHLERVGRTKGFVAARARALAAAMRALDARLARSGACDGRLAGPLLATALENASGELVADVVGARQLRSRWLLAWHAADLAWWRALDDKLAPLGGGARVVVPSFDRPLEGSRERDPLEILTEEIVRALDAPAETEPVAAVLGDLTGAPVRPPPEGRVRIVRAGDLVAQAAAVAGLVDAALRGGAAVERVAIALPVLDERTLAPLRRALEARGIIAHEARGAPPSEAPVVAAAFLALEAARSLDRRDVARLLRSGWVDAVRFARPTEARDADAAPTASSDDDEAARPTRRDAERRLNRIARALESAATVAGSDGAERLVKTALVRTGSARGEAAELDTDAAYAKALVAVLASARDASTRLERARAARRLWAELGLGARAGRGGLATFSSDAAPGGVHRAERLAIARDARAWDALVTALDLYESVTIASGAEAQPLDGDTFRLELVALLDAGAGQPGASRTSAVRIVRLADAAGDELDLLLVADAVDGLLPRDATEHSLVSTALAETIARASRGVYIAPTPAATRAHDLAALAVAAADARELVLVYPREDASGAPVSPSGVIDDLVRAGLSIEAATEGVVTPRRTTSGPNSAELALRVARERAREGFFLDPARPRSDVVGDVAPPGALSRLLVTETGGADRALAVTGLERLARCPFMGFAHVVLAAREADRREELPDAREEGTLVHEVLAAAFLATRELWPRRPRDAEAILERGVSAADRVLERWQGHAPLRAIVRLRVADAVRAVLRGALADETWDFALAEQSFGGGPRVGESPPWPALVIEDEEVRLLLRGSIDRVDRAHDGRAVRVVDYKRNKNTVRDSSNALGVTALQVPIYACVAARELGVPATGMYAPTQARDITAEARPNAKVAERMDDLVRREGGVSSEIERRTLAIVSSARAGMLAPIPADEAECRTCAVSGGCRKPRFAMAPLEETEGE